MPFDFYEPLGVGLFFTLSPGLFGGGWMGFRFQTRLVFGGVGMMWYRVFLEKDTKVQGGFPCLVWIGGSVGLARLAVISVNLVSMKAPTVSVKFEFCSLRHSSPFFIFLK